jgi:hypothetical protein
MRSLPSNAQVFVCKVRGFEEMGHPLEETVAHPLFTVDEDSDDDEIKTVTSIHIARKENGKLFYAPRPRAANELVSLEQIQGEFGGGEYVLIGYNNGRISARRTLNLPGKPKPLFDEGVPETTSQPSVSTPPSDPMSAMMGGGQGGLMGLIMMMMQQMMQQQAQAASSQTQMFIAMMQGNQQQSTEEKAQARAELQANIERERIASERTMSLMREMMQNKGSSTGDDFYKGVEFMRSQMSQQLEMLKNSKGGDDSSDLMETIGMLIQGVSMFNQVKQGGLPEGVPVVPEAAQ